MEVVFSLFVGGVLFLVIRTATGLVVRRFDGPEMPNED